MGSIQGLHHSADQILVGLQDIFAEAGLDPWFALDTRIDVYLKQEDEWDEFDLRDLIRMVEQWFDFRATDNEWREFFGYSCRNPQEWEEEYGRRFTFESLARFICERVAIAPVKPVIVFGSPCLSSGVFRRLEQMISEVRPGTRRFAPSTPIWLRIRGQELRIFWGRLRWMSGGVLPRLDFRTRGRRRYNRFSVEIALSFVISLVIAYIQWAGPHDVASWIMGILMVGFIAFLLCATFFERLGDRVFCPLPEGFRTFRELATFLSAESSELLTGPAPAGRLRRT